MNIENGKSFGAPKLTALIGGCLNTQSANPPLLVWETLIQNPGLPATPEVVKVRF